MTDLRIENSKKLNCLHNIDCKTYQNFWYMYCIFSAFLLCHHLLFLTSFSTTTDTNFDTKVEKKKQGKTQSYRCCRSLSTKATTTITIMMMNHFCIHNIPHKKTHLSHRTIGEWQKFQICHNESFWYFIPCINQ